MLEQLLMPQEEVEAITTTAIRQMLGVWLVFEEHDGMQMTGVDAYVDRVLQAIPGNDVLNRRSGWVIAASEIYWERRGAGIKQMAQNYLMQKNDGQWRQRRPWSSVSAQEL